VHSRLSPLACLLAAVLLVAPTGVAAQSPASGAAAAGPEVSVSGAALTPLALLTETPGTFGTEISTGLGVTGTAGYWLGGGFGVVAQGGWIPAELDLQQAEFTGPIPDQLGDADYLVGTLNLVYRLTLPGPAAAVEPFFGIGGGVRDLDVDPQASPDVEDATDLAGTITAGAYARLWAGGHLRLAVRDVVTSYRSPLSGESRLQNDILVSVGLSFRP
jgi:hypothetical protein